ncbi:hypothetical protein D3C85_1536020 [compost metagenome]
MGKSSVSVEVEFAVRGVGDSTVEQFIREVAFHDAHEATVTTAVTATLRADVVNRGLLL